MNLATLRRYYFVLEGLNGVAAAYYFNYLFFYMRDHFGFGNRHNLMLTALHGGFTHLPLERGKGCPATRLHVLPAAWFFWNGAGDGARRVCAEGFWIFTRGNDRADCRAGVVDLHDVFYVANLAGSPEPPSDAGRDVTERRYL